MLRSKTESVSLILANQMSRFFFASFHFISLPIFRFAVFALKKLTTSAEPGLRNIKKTTSCNCPISVPCSFTRPFSLCFFFLSHCFALIHYVSFRFAFFASLRVVSFSFRICNLLFLFGVKQSK
jgi:hypothetical protein